MAYNTTQFHGKLARVEIGAAAMDYSTGWSLDVVMDMSDTSRQGQHWKEGLAGLTGWSGSFAGQVVLGNAQQISFVNNIIAAIPGTQLTTLQLLLDADTNAFTGNIFVTGYSVGATKDGTAVHTFNFTGDGALSVTNAA